MLELIVLGEVPGTRMQITVSWALIAGAIFLMSIESYLIYQRRHQSVTKRPAGTA